MTIPLAGFPMQNEERRALFRAARVFGSNPLEVASYAYDSMGVFLDAGNFRPVGRFAEKAGYAFAVEAAEATGLALYVVQGMIRLLLVAILAMTAASAVSAVMRSAGVGSAARPTLVLYSLVFATTLVASHHLSSLSAFPVVFIGSAVMVLGVVQLVARDRDMEDRPLSWHEPVAMALLGAATAMTFELLYVVPPLAAGFIAVRAAAAGRKPGFVLRSAAMRRWLALSVGFLAIFVPVRIMIANHCRQEYCSRASDISLSGDVPGLVADRMLTGAPPAGWIHTADRVRPYGFEVGASDLAGNWLLAALLVVIVAATVRAVVRATSRTATAEDVPGARARLAVCLGALGALTVVLPALLVSPSKEIQEALPAIGEAYRDTLMVQVGWSFIITAVVVAGIAAVGTRRLPRVAAAAVAATALWVGLAMTLLTNERMAHIGRGLPESAIVRQVSTAVISIDPTDGGNARRCGLIDAYTELSPGPLGWWTGPKLRGELDHFMLDRYGWPFCDGPEAPEPGSAPPSDWEWRNQGNWWE